MTERQNSVERNRGLCQRSMTDRSDGFMSGVAILSLSAVIVKIIGLIYKIPMLRLLGSEGMGYFNSAYEIYTLFCTVATTGLPVAMSAIISSFAKEDRELRAEDVRRVAGRVFLILGVLGSAVMITFARPFALFLGNESAFWCVVAISPTVLLICIVSTYRGYFQGFGKMLPTAVSQIIEAGGKLVLGLVFAFAALNAGLESELVAAFAVLGLVIGSAMSALYLALSKRMAERAIPKLPRVRIYERGISKRLLKIAVPVTLSSGVISLTKVIDMTVILKRLQSTGMDGDSAFAVYGNYTTLALPLFSLAPALISCVAMPLIPALSRAITEKNDEEQRNAVSDALRLTAIISMPISLGLALFSKQILSLIFSSAPDAVNMTSPLLSILAVSVPLSCLITVGNAILQAYGKASFPVVSVVIGSLVKLILAYFLIGIPQIGIYGAPISTFFCDLLINIANFGCICKHTRKMPTVIEVLVRPFSAALLSIIAARLCFSLLKEHLSSDNMATLVSIAIAGVLYAVTSLLFGAINKKDIARLPLVGRLANFNKVKNI